MATVTVAPAEVLDQYLAPDLDAMETMNQEAATKGHRPLVIVWRNVAIFSVLHITAFYGAWLMMTRGAWATIAWVVILHIVGITGLTAGAHRLWAHRSYKATISARILLMLMSTVSFENDVIEWARDHRCHHKWTDTEADPHNSKRGFFYSHVGWLMCKKSSEIKRLGSKIDLSDLYADPVLTFQKRHYLVLSSIFCFLLPAVIPVYAWGESPWTSFLASAIFRLTFTYHITWLINSAAHKFGYRPYDASISAVQSIWMNMPAMGEGMHNFHHTFPQDYRASEFSWLTNWTTFFLDVLAAVGLVYDQKMISSEGITRQMAAKGDIQYRYTHAK